MELRSPFDFDEYWRASREIQRLSGQQRGTWGLALGPPVLLSLLSLVLAGDLNAGLGRMLLWPWFFFPLFATFGIRAIAWWSLRRAVRANPRLRGELVRIVGDDGLEVRDDGTAAKLEWRVMERIVETEEFFHFFFTRQCAYFIPQRLLTAEGRSSLRALIAEHRRDVAVLRPGV